jgi:hypothetical protein
MFPSESLRNMVNKIRELSVESNSIYAQKVPYIESTDAISRIATPILDSSNLDVMNDFVSILKKIAYTAIEAKTFSNPLAFLEGDEMPLGQFVESISIAPAKANYMNSNDFGSLLHKFESRFATQYLSCNYDMQYAVSLTRDKIRNAFTSWANLESFVQGLIQSLYNGAQIDLYRTVKQLPAVALKDNNVMYETVTAVTDEASAKALVEKLRATYTKMQLPSTNFNAWNKVAEDGFALEAWSDPDDIVVMITADLDAKLSVQDWAYAFGERYAQILGRKIVVDNFDCYDNDGNKIYDGSGIQAVIADKRWFKIQTQDQSLDMFFNASARAWTYFYNLTKLIAYSYFNQCLILCTSGSVPTIDATDLEVNASSATVKAGATVKVGFKTTPFNATSEVTVASSASGKATATIVGREVVIEGKSAGSATITVTANGHSDTISVTVESASE